MLTTNEGKRRNNTVSERDGRTGGKPAPVLFGVVFLCIISVFSFLTIVLPKKSFSDSENRVLASIPSLSQDALRSGEYFQDLQTWFSDHFIGRDFWITMELKIKTVLGIKENGGVYLGKENTLFLIPGKPDTEALEKNEAAADAFASYYKDLNHCMMIVPNAVTIHKELLPDNAPVPDQEAQLAALAQQVPNLSFVDCTKALLVHNDERLFYKTDHHWTGLGAYYAFGELQKAMGLKTTKNYDRMILSDSFEGTLASKSGKHDEKDSIEIFVPDDDVSYYVTYDGGFEKTPTLFSMDALSQKDQYSVFLGGNHPIVDIVTTADSGRKLLLFKDSFANSFVQFLVPCFEEIVMIDPRYYYDSVYPLISQKGITDVLYLYNADTFFGDTALADVLSLPANE